MNDSMIISDELLAAFLDGNTNAEDTMRVLKAAEQDEELRELIRIVSMKIWRGGRLPRLRNFP